MRQRRTAHGTRRLRAMLAAATVVAVTALSGTAAAAEPATTATSTTTSTEAGVSTATSTDSLPVSVSVTSISPQVLLPGDELTVTATLTNEGTDTIDSPRASLRIYRYRLSSSEQLQSWADSGTSSPIGDVAATVRLDDPLEPGASTTVVITVEPDAIGLTQTADAWGPRGVTVDVADGGRRVGIERTFLVWASDDEPTTAQVGVLAPVVGPATDPAATALAEEDEQSEDETGPTPEPSATATAGATEGTSTDDDALTEATASNGRLSRLLAATADYSVVSWAIDPALVESASTGSRSAQSWLSDLEQSAADHEVLRLPWADPDLAAIAHAGSTDGGDADGLLELATDATGSTESSALWDDAEPVLLSADDVPDQVTAALAAADGDGAPLVTGSSAMPTDGSTTASSVATVSTSAGDLVTLVPDDTLSSLLTDPSSVQEGLTAATAAQWVLAETAVLARADDAATTYVLATVPRDWEASTELAQAQLQALSEAPWVQATSVAEMLAAQAAGTAGDSTDERAALPENEQSGNELTPDWVEALADSWSSATSFASVVDDPDALLSGLAGDLVSPLSVAWRSDPEGRSTAVTDAIAESNARQSGLSLLLNEQFTVISSSAQISVAVKNDLDQDATVRVELRPQKGCLETARSPLVTVAANRETTVTLTLEATANCDVDVEVSLLSEDNRVLAGTVEFSARVAPTIESVGAILVGVLLALGLTFGIWRTIRRGQTTRRGAKVLPPDGDEPAPGTGAAAADDQQRPTDPDDPDPPPERQDT
ncbi:MAG TPA: DUF6049 family protein [Cellulomonas sp.]